MSELCGVTYHLG